MEQTVKIPKEDLVKAEIYAKSLPKKVPALDYIDREQLEVEALLGLEKAKKAWTGTRAKFHQFAYRVMRNCINEEIRRQSIWTRQQRNIRKKNLMEGNEPEAWMLPPLSFEDLTNGKSVEYEEDHMPMYPIFFSEEMDSDRRILLRHLLSVLSEREKRIVFERIALQKTEREIKIRSEIDGSYICRERIQQLYKKALEKMRAEAEKLGLARI